MLVRTYVNRRLRTKLLFCRQDIRERGVKLMCFCKAFGIGFNYLNALDRFRNQLNNSVTVFPRLVEVSTPITSNSCY